MSRKQPYILSLDIGTSSTRAAIYDAAGAPLANATHSRPQRVHTTADGGAEMHAEDVIQRTLLCAAEALRGAGPAARAVAGVAVSTYWHSTLGVNARGKAATPIYLWSDTRSVAEVNSCGSGWMRRRCGAPLPAAHLLRGAQAGLAGAR